MPGLSYSQIPRLIFLTLKDEPEYQVEVLKNFLLGLLFAALGMFGVLRSAGRETKTMKMKDLS